MIFDGLTLIAELGRSAGLRVFRPAVSFCLAAPGRYKSDQAPPPGSTARVCIP